MARGVFIYGTFVLLLIFSFKQEISSLDSKCKENKAIVISYWNHRPYIYKLGGTSRITGIFPAVLTEALQTCCPGSNVEYKVVNSGMAGLVELTNSADFDMICPVGGSPNDLSFRGFPFIGITESSGVAVLMKGNASGTRLLLSVLSAWPILVFIVISASLAGIVIWFLERKANPDQFPATFSRGVFEGFWWAFVTMTTVGYGDKAPKTFFGKILGSIWILAGLIITTMFISIITSALAESSAAEGKANVRGVKVSVVNQSEEHKLAIRQNAQIIAVQDQNQVFKELTDRNVDAALVDVHSLKFIREELIKNFVLVTSVIPNHISYGMVLSRNSTMLSNCLREFMEIKENWIYQLLQENAGSKKVEITPADDYFGSGGIFSISVYAGLGLFVALFCGGLVWEYYKHRKRARTKNKMENSDDKEAKNGKIAAPKETDGNGKDLQSNSLTINKTKDKKEPNNAKLIVNVPLHLPTRLSFGRTPQEQLLSQQSMEVMQMENQFNLFKVEWEKRYNLLLNLQGQNGMGMANGGFHNRDGN